MSLSVAQLNRATLGRQLLLRREPEARQPAAFLADRDPAVYRRYSRWWDGLPGAEVVVLPG